MQVVDGFNLVNELRVVITTVYVQLLLDQFARHLSDRFLIIRAAGTLHHRRFFHLGSARTAFCVRPVCGGARHIIAVFGDHFRRHEANGQIADLVPLVAHRDKPLSVLIAASLQRLIVLSAALQDLRQFGH